MMGRFITYTLLIASVIFLQHSKTELEKENSRLQLTVKNDDAEKAALSEVIDGLRSQYADAQTAADTFYLQHIQERAGLRERIGQLDGQLKNETCFDEPVHYPIGWVSGYQ